jgi:hypothetical protein
VWLCAPGERQIRAIPFRVAGPNPSDLASLTTKIFAPCYSLHCEKGKGRKVLRKGRKEFSLSRGFASSPGALCGGALNQNTQLELCPELPHHNSPDFHLWLISPGDYRENMRRHLGRCIEWMKTR